MQQLYIKSSKPYEFTILTVLGNEIGHISKNCEQEKNEASKIIIACANCSNEGHRARDCVEPRKSGKKGCRNCGNEDHIAKDCTEPRDLSDVECKNCNEMGHFSRDCPSREPEVCRNCKQEGHRSKDCTNERVMQCRNCDGLGHVARECPEPKDMTKIQCRNCECFSWLSMPISTLTICVQATSSVTTAVDAQSRPIGLESSALTATRRDTRTSAARTKPPRLKAALAVVGRMVLVRLLVVLRLPAAEVVGRALLLIQSQSHLLVVGKGTSPTLVTFAVTSSTSRFALDIFVSCSRFRESPAVTQAPTGQR